MIATRLLIASSCKSSDSNGFLMREIFRFALYLDYFGLVLPSLNLFCWHSLISLSSLLFCLSLAFVVVD